MVFGGAIELNILVLNAGSSSLKYSLFRMEKLIPLNEHEDIITKGQVEVDAGTLDRAVDKVFTEVRNSTGKGKAEITVDVVGHRIVHGGAKFFEPTLIDTESLSAIHDLTELAPLHNPSGLAGIEASMKILPNIPNVAIFDTAFHHKLSDVASRYALPTELAERLQLRRYGFHGISYRYVMERTLLCLNRPTTGSRLIICHLGNGASVCAIRDGQSIDTSMGFTPLEGLIMGTRCGDIDPGLILHLTRTEHLTIEQMDDLLNHKSGLLGLSGGKSDVRDLEEAEIAGDEAARLALDCFAYRVRKYIGAYAAVLGGVDALIFTGGIGEHSAFIRSRICDGLNFLFLGIDEKINNNLNAGAPTPIGQEEGIRVWVIPTDEARQIARETYAMLHR